VYNPQGLDIFEIVAASWLCSWAVLGVTTTAAVALSWWVFGDEKAAAPAPAAVPAQPTRAPAASVAHA
jgi:hypothetical protein